MSIETTFVKILTEDDDMAALIEDRIYPIRAPLNAPMPYVIYNRIAGQRVLAHDGPTGVAKATFQFLVIDDDYAVMRSVVETLRTVLDGRQFGIISVTHIANDPDEYAPEAGLGQWFMGRTSFDFIYQE